MPPPWLVEVVRPAPAKPPWAAMLRAAMAVCGPLALGNIVGAPVPGLLGAMGGLLGAVVDRGGTYPARIKRVATAGIFGGAAGLLLGTLVHGRGWLEVLVLVLVAGLSAVLSAAGATAAITTLRHRAAGRVRVVAVELARSPAGATGHRARYGGPVHGPGTARRARPFRAPAGYLPGSF